jgi:hypothetical protein
LQLCNSRLTLPGSVQETDHSSAKYLSDESKFVITLDKTCPGQHFQGLELITTLLQPKKGPGHDNKRKNRIIQIMEGIYNLVFVSNCNFARFIL